MKLLLSTGIATIASASQLTDMMADLMNTTSIKSARNFGFSGPVGSFTDLFSDYGCWCRMGDVTNTGYVGHGNGDVQDAYDGECKLLHDNYACLVVEESTCDPFNIYYDRPGPVGNPSYWLGELQRADLTAAEIESECITANGGNFAPLCDRSACIIESTFLHKFFQLYNNGEINDAVYGSAAFDKSTCSMGNSFSSWSGSRGTKRCCGTYSSYKQIYYDGTKGCCNNENVYSITAKKCCASGAVKEMAASC